MFDFHAPCLREQLCVELSREVVDGSAPGHQVASRLPPLNRVTVPLHPRLVIPEKPRLTFRRQAIWYPQWLAPRLGVYDILVFHYDTYTFVPCKITWPSAMIRKYHPSRTTGWLPYNSKKNSSVLAAAGWSQLAVVTVSSPLRSPENHLCHPLPPS